MRSRLVVALFLILGSSSLFAKDAYLSVTGKANGFFSDARIFNPSYEKSIVITARYLPAGNGDNSGVVAKTITIAKRSMAIYDDAVASLFGGGGGAPLGAIRLTSDDDFVATERIYADLTSTQRGTLGQFVPALDAAAARKKGVLLQLKIGAASLGNFRTNWGGVNPNNATAHVTLKLFDKNSALAATKTIDIAPFGVLSPTSVPAFFGNPANDLSDSWMSYDSDQPLFLYGSVVDNTSTDPTFIPGAEDSGVAPPDNPEPPPAKIVTVTARDFTFTVSPSAPLKPGDTVTFRISNVQGDHGFYLAAPSGDELISIPLLPKSGVVERTVTLPSGGRYDFFCTNPCGIGHSGMQGSFTVNP
ncbi:MAG: hypothetical protein M3Q69_07790 [Acidobacteriota bacterium]|nr:hypothetical protein [Acidobacteriota bacterium]